MKRILVILGLLTSLSLILAPTTASATSVIPFTSPSANGCYPQQPEGGLGACFEYHYQIVGSGQFVDYFSRTLYNESAVMPLIASKMCGWSFGCAWQDRSVPLGSSINLTITENRNMAKGNYSWCLLYSGFGQKCLTYAVE